MAEYFMRVDGTAQRKEQATGPTSDVTRCMNTYTHNHEFFVPGDIINITGNGGIYRSTIIPPSSGIYKEPILYNWLEGSYVSGMDIKEDWAILTDNTYYIPETTEPKIVAINGRKAKKGLNMTSLEDNEWYWTNNELYYRSNTGNPDILGLTIEAGKRDICVDVTWKNFISMRGLRAGFANANTLVASSCKNFEADDVEIGPTGMVIGNGAVIFINADNSTFTNSRILAGSEAQGMFCLDCTGSLVIKNNVIEPSSGYPNNSIQIINAENIELLDNLCTVISRPDGKGCISTNGNIQGVRAINNKLFGGNWGLALNGTNIEACYNWIHKVGIGSEQTWPAAFHLAGVESKNHEYIGNVISDCMNGISLWGNLRWSHNFYDNIIINSQRYDFIVNTTGVSGNFKRNVLWSSQAKTSAMRVDQIINEEIWESDFNIINDTIGFSYQKTDYPTLTAYIAGTDQDKNSSNEISTVELLLLLKSHYQINTNIN